MKNSRYKTERVMSSRNLLIYAFLFVSIVIKAQIPNNSWRDHLAYNRGKTLAITPEKIFCSMTSGGMISYEKATGEIEKLSKVTGLSDINISTIAYSETANVLVIGYVNGNIDLLTAKGIINMPDIKEKRIVGTKSINHITIKETSAFLACDFGIVEIDLKKLEIRDSYFFGSEGTAIHVNDITIFNNYLYAATAKGMYRADLNSPNLVDYSYWSRIDEIPQHTGSFKFIEAVSDKLIICYTDSLTGYDKTILLKDNTYDVWNPVSDSIIYQISFYNDKLAVVTDTITYFYNNNLQYTETVKLLRGRHVVSDTDGTIAAATNSKGLILIRNKVDEDVISVKSPRFNTTGYIDTKEDKVWVGSGGPFNLYSQASAHKFSNEKWRSFSPGYYDGMQGIGNVYKFAFHPTNSDHVYASAYLYALLEIKDNEVIAKHDLTTVPLFKEVIPENVGVRIMDMAFDKRGNLWTVMDEQIQPVFVLGNGSEWEHKVFDIDMFKSTSQWRGLLVTETNQIWILNKTKGVVVLREESDGYFNKKEFAIVNEDGNDLSKANCMVEDKDGNIWIGTNKGPIVYYPSNSIFDDPEVNGNQIKLPRNDGTNAADYLLDYETINDIAVDGGNRKWLATETSGVFLVSADGQETLHQFTTENSPMISNNVISVGVNEKTGEVFISTSEGLVGFMGRATEGQEDFNNVYVYPNPISPDYEGDITITGLIEDANVKITDISGNLVYETTSLGGQAIWSGRNYDGNRVHTGVYLVFMTNTDGTKKEVTKLVFIH